jgi:hypothetical protein
VDVGVGSKRYEVGGKKYLLRQWLIVYRPNSSAYFLVV